MLLLVEKDAEKRSAQKAIETALTAQLALVGKRNIGFPSGNFDATVYSNGDGKLWAAFLDLDKHVPRRWNAFGVYEKNRHAQMITVEINVPTNSNSASVAGFFARDPATGATYLMHDGSVGGGKKGVGRGAFMSWSNRALVEVKRTDREPRDGIVIGRVDDPDLSGRIWHFVQAVRAFKDAVKRGDLNTETARQTRAEWDTFKSESAGSRKGRRRAEIDYISYHGDIVEALRAEREAMANDEEHVLNSPFIDLMVVSGKAMTENYEIKTCCNRQSLYTAIGQLLAHSTDAPDDIVRTLVVPDDDLPSGLELCFAKLGIMVRRFKMTAAPNSKVLLL